MLVLTRKMNEQIQIGDNITVSILRIKGNAVRVGIQAPRQVRVVRGELPPLLERGGDGRTFASLEARGGGVAEHTLTSDGPADMTADDDFCEQIWSVGSLVS